MSTINFNEYTEPEKGTKEFKKTEFLRLTEGSHIVRILQPEMKLYSQHWIGGPIECLGDDCPQCAQNKLILSQLDNDFKSATKVDGFNWPQRRSAVNVLDRTPVKICKSCGFENKAVNDVFSPTCSHCNIVIAAVEPKPLNEIKLFTRAESVFAKIATIAKTKLNADGDPIGITNFDLELLVAGNTTIPRGTNNTDDVEVDEESFYDLNTAVISLTPDEMLQRMRGVSLKDIFAKRRGETPVEEVKEAKPKLSMDEINQRLDELF